MGIIAEDKNTHAQNEPCLLQEHGWNVGGLDAPQEVYSPGEGMTSHMSTVEIRMLW